jgi:tRNA threonylcarbamoyladenosine biosynthesis protein TsaB
MSEPGAFGSGKRAPVVLAFDTAGAACSVAVGCGDALLAYERRDMRHGHAEALLPMIDQTMATTGLTPSDIDIIAASVGPGGFTGIRAGLAAAQGLALAAQARLVGVTSFAAVAALVPTGEAALLVALDSRREEYYVQIFDRSRDPCGAPAAILPDELVALVAAVVGDASLLVAGDAAANAAAALAERRGVTIVSGSAPDALGVLAMARQKGFSDAARALYLRPPDVSFPRARRGGDAG